MDVLVLRLDDVETTGGDSPPGRVVAAAHLEVPVENEEEAVLVGVLDVPLDVPLDRSAALLLARELDEVLEQPQTDPTDGWEPSQAARSGSRVHRVRVGEGG
jgi:hypothetical protein